VRQEAIALNKGEKLNGRNIYDRALSCIAMCKVALRYYYHEFCPGGKLPSSKTVEDMLLHVRQKMYVHLRGAKNNSPIKKDEADQKIYTEEDMPDKRLFLMGGLHFFSLVPHTDSPTQCSLVCQRMMARI
jgi:hypothetical protein